MKYEMTFEQRERVDKAKIPQNTIKNKRNFPTTKEVLENREFDMKTYVKMQVESNRTDEIDEHRYIKIDSINYLRWSKELGVSPKTLKKNIQLLLKSGIISKFVSSNGEAYYKIQNKFEYYLLFQEGFARSLLDSCTKNLIKVYFLYYKYSDLYGVCKLSQKDILKQIGYPYNSSSAKMLKNINDALVKLGLISVEKVYENKDKKTKLFLEIVAHHYLETEFYKNSTTSY